MLQYTWLEFKSQLEGKEKSKKEKEVKVSCMNLAEIHPFFVYHEKEN